MKLHNTHILIPEVLWKRLTTRAKSEKTTKTAVICQALTKYLASRPRKERS